MAFAGTPPFAAAILNGLLESGFRVERVYTQPDRPAGRGRRLRASAVKDVARARGVRVETPPRLRPPEQAIAVAAALTELDAMVVVAYGLLLPRPVLEAPRFGCINVHASLLPRWRGAAPIERAIMAGDARTGVSIMQMDEGLDSGPVLARAEMEIGPDTTGKDARKRLAVLGLETLIDTLRQLERVVAMPQDETRATYAAKLTAADARIDWSRPAQEIARTVNALNDQLPAHSHLGALRIRLLRARACEPAARSSIPREPGEIVGFSANGLDIACGGESVLRVLELQLPGKPARPIASLVHGARALFETGQRWSTEPVT